MFWTSKRCAPGFQVPKDLAEVGNRSGKPVELGDDQHITGPKIVEGGIQLLPL